MRAILKYVLSASSAETKAPSFHRREATLFTVVCFVVFAVAFFIWHVAMVAARKEVHLGAFSFLLPMTNFWSQNIVVINLCIAAVMMVLFGIIAYANGANARTRITFVLWCVGWMVQIVGIVLTQFVKYSGFVYWDAACSIAILAGCLYVRGRLYVKGQLNWNSAILLTLPLIAAVASPLVDYHYWPSSFVNYFVFLYFAIVLLNHYRDRCLVPSYLIFTSYTIYAAIQLLFPIMQFLDEGTPPHELLRVLGYTLGAFAKLGGFAGLVLAILMEIPPPSPPGAHYERIEVPLAAP